MNPGADTLIPCFRTPAVRDLAWACFSEPLFLCKGLPPGAGPLQNCTLQLTPERAQWLERLDREPAALLAQVEETRKGRLGLYFEHLWHFFLRQDPAVDLLAHNLPVRHGTRTLGEFDCLYYCHQRQQYIHLELAVKFYLQAAPHDVEHDGRVVDQDQPTGGSRGAHAGRVPAKARFGKRGAAPLL